MATQITVTRAIATQKALTARIGEMTKLLVLTAPTRGEDKHRELSTGYKGTIEDAEREIGTGWQRLQDYIAVRNAIRAELVKSNALTTIDIAGKSMTIVEALDYRNSLPEKQAIVDRLKANAVNTQNAYDKAFAQHEARLTALRSEAMSNGKEVNAEFNRDFIDPINRTSRPDVLDPLKVGDIVAKMEKEIQDFKLNIDYALSESNALTKITIEGHGIVE